MRKNISMTIALLCMVVQTAWAQFSGGSGTQADNTPGQSWIETFRAYFQTASTYDVDTFTPMYTFTGAADEVETGELEAFPINNFVGDLPDGQGTAIHPAIRTVEADGTSRYFDLQGRQIGTKPVRGVYIRDGKKLVSNPSR